MVREAASCRYPKFLHKGGGAARTAFVLFRPMGPLRFLRLMLMLGRHVGPFLSDTARPREY